MLLRSRVFETINVRGAGVAAQHVLVTSSGTTARADLLLNNGAVVFEAKALQHGLSNAEFAQVRPGRDCPGASGEGRHAKGAALTLWRDAILC